MNTVTPCPYVFGPFCVLIRFGPPDPDQKHDFAVLGADAAGAKPWACPMVSRVVEHAPPTSHITYIVYLLLYSMGEWFWYPRRPQQQSSIAASITPIGINPLASFVLAQARLDQTPRQQTAAGTGGVCPRGAVPSPRPRTRYPLGRRPPLKPEKVQAGVSHQAAVQSLGPSPLIRCHLSVAI